MVASARMLAISSFEVLRCSHPQGSSDLGEVPLLTCLAFSLWLLSSALSSRSALDHVLFAREIMPSKLKDRSGPKWHCQRTEISVQVRNVASCGAMSDNVRSAIRLQTAVRRYVLASECMACCRDASALDLKLRSVVAMKMVGSPSSSSKST